MIDKKLIYAGVGLLVVLIVYNSTRKMQLVSISEPSTKNNFDSSSLPSFLKPPHRINDGEPIPAPVKKEFSLNLIGVYPRFDTA
jgi:hypothetical protein